MFLYKYPLYKYGACLTARHKFRDSRVSIIIFPSPFFIFFHFFLFFFFV